MFPHCAGLTKVNLSCYELTDGGIGELARHCAGLTEVDLSGWGTDKETNKL
jgi:hypothetical protein